MKEEEIKIIKEEKIQDASDWRFDLRCTEFMKEAEIIEFFKNKKGIKKAKTKSKNYFDFLKRSFGKSPEKRFLKLRRKILKKEMGSSLLRNLSRFNLFKFLRLNLSEKISNLTLKRAVAIVTIFATIGLTFLKDAPTSQSATFIWNQNSWTTESSNNAVHPDDENDWNQYSAKDAGITAGANVALTQSSGSVTHTTDTDFNGTNSSTAVSGTGSGASVQLSPSPISATGGTITTNGGYTIHTFISDGTFTVTGGGANVQALVVGGGGSGGSASNSLAGGGGGGGVVYNSSYAVTPQAYPVTVGDGGLPSSAGQNNGNKGEDSVFGTITAVGGGYGGTLDNGGGNGGSGGGAGQAYNVNVNGGTGTSGQGYDGGDSTNKANSAGAGGGGASEAGVSITGIIGGNGGDGVENSISGTAVTYGGGGGGGGMNTAGTGGSGGGGNGNRISAGGGTAGTENTGGGGGGGSSYSTAAGFAGGSGIVIIRYLTPVSSGNYTSASIDLGQVSDLTTLGISKTVPSQIAFLKSLGKNYTVAAGTYHTCYLRSNGNSQCYGFNSSGQITAYPGDDAVGVAVGRFITCYLKSNGNSQCYGDNSSGETTAYPGGDAVGVAAGGNHTCYLKSNGNSQCYGNNSYGQATAYPGGDAVGVAAGRFFTCYLKSNGNSQCYGNNSYGETTAYPGGDAVGVAVGSGHTCYLKSNGNSQCYGNSSYGQTTAYPGGDAVGVAAGENHTCYLKSNGNSQCYGNSSYGQTTAYPGGDAVGVAAGAGGNHTCYLKSNGNSQCYGNNAQGSGQATAYTGGDAQFPYTLKFQLAANNDNSTWNYVGPDGTASTYFTTTGTAFPSSLDGNRYVRYKLYLGTIDTAYTPSLNDITINYNYYPTLQTLTSSKYDTTDPANALGKIQWGEDLPSGADIKFQLRTSADGSTWTDWLGPDGTTGDYFEDFTGGESMPVAFTDGVNDRWIQYKAYLSSDGTSMPTLAYVDLIYVVNATPEVQITSASQGSDGVVTVNYNVRDSDTDDPGAATPGKVIASLQYCTADCDSPGSETWADATTVSSPDGGLGSDVAVEEVNWNSYTILWTPKTDYDEQYNAGMKIRVKANDSEGANNYGYGTSSAFVLDTEDPTNCSFTINHTTNQLTLTTPTDDSSFQMGVSNIAGTFPTFEAFASPYAYGSMTSDPATVYVRVKDAYGNYTDAQATTPAQPQNPIYFDTSNQPDGVYQEFIAWDVISTSQVGSGFSSYKVHRKIDDGSFTLLATISDRNTNYLLDKIHGTSTESDPAFDPNNPSSYTYKIIATDTNGNISEYSSTVTDTPNGVGGSDSTPPTITDVTVSNINTTSAKITWTTDEIADSSVGYSEDYTYLPERGLASMVTSHEIALTGLDPGTTYHIKIKSRDSSTSSNLGSACYGGDGCSPGSNDPDVFTFATHPGPAISGVATSTSNYQATVSWITSTNSNTYVVYSDTVLAGELVDPDEIGNPDPVGGGPNYNHSQTVTTYNDVALESGAAYYFYVRSVDGSDNEAVDDNGGNFYSFTTTQDDDPPAIDNIDEVIINNTQAAINWTTDEAATSLVNYGTEEGGLYTDSAEVLTFDASHYVILSGLDPNTEYFYTVTSADINTNESTSIEHSFTTLRNPEEQHDPLSEITDVSDPLSVITDEKAVVTFTTDQPAQCVIEYGTQAGNYTEVPVSESEYNEGHSIHLSGLIFSTTYYYQITCADNLDNTIESSEYSFTTADQQFGSGELDSAAPSISGVSAGTLTGESATITWDTDEESNSSIAYGIVSGTYENGAIDYLVNSEVANFVTTHSVIINGLIPATKYYFIAMSTDAAGNIGQSSEGTFTTASPSSISSITVTSTSLNEATVTWNTSTNMSSIVEYGLTTTYSEIKESSTATKAHSVFLSGLQSGQVYHLRVKGEDANNNLYASADYTFTPKSPPVISGISISNVTEHEVTVKFATNVPTDALITYTDPKNPKNSGSQGKPDLATGHEVTLNNLASGTAFGYTIKARDLDGNETTTATVQSFTTGKDEKPPVIENAKTDSALAQNDKVQTIISWVTDELSDTSLVYKEGLSGQEKEYKISDIPTTSHISVVTIFKPGTVYYFKVKSTDLSGNTATSDDYALLTPKRKENIIQMIVNNFQEIFGWARF